MSRLKVVPIVEGHGEYSCIRTLIDRVWRELLGGEYVAIARPIREKRHRLVKPDTLQKAVTLAYSKLAQMADADDPSLVLVLVDADKDFPCVLGPRLLEIAQQTRPDADVTCIVASVEYETWFVAAAESLTEYLHIDPAEVIPTNPEAMGLGKAWVQRHFRGPGVRYSETQDQPAMTATMDLRLCRSRAVVRQVLPRTRAPAARLNRFTVPALPLSRDVPKEDELRRACYLPHGLRAKPAGGYRPLPAGKGRRRARSPTC